jgi:F-type H+-transporting ATPase subunit epsilon
LIVALQVELVSPERILYSGEASTVIVRSAGGDIAFLTGHAPFVGTLGVAKLRIIQTDDTEVVVAVHGGFVEVKDNRVTILSDVAELASQVDVDRARASLAQAIADVDEAARRRAEVRLEVAGVSA